MTPEQERAYYDNVLARICCNPRYYLDNLENMDVFRVSFLNYGISRRVKVKGRLPKKEGLIKESQHIDKSLEK
jgi:hypothetical protein